MAPRPSKLRSVKPEQAQHADPGDSIRLTADRILVQVPDESERRSKGGLVIPATGATPIKRCVWSDVVLVGPETRNVKKGDGVLFIPHSGLEVDGQGETFLLPRERDIQAVSCDRAEPHP